mmetsp:Transcript_61480/g.73037  ORF Transcript_61480/g.73037 Transcript_61480/m.73037 type:complete len:136 (-) Transcript_61480:611-1018(-)
MGDVKLKSPDIALFACIFGDKRVMILREVFCGFGELRRYDPNTRICVTSTPLKPIAAFVMANCGRVSSHSKVFDVCAGLCTTLLASAALAPGCRPVGIERAKDYLVSFPDIEKDFSSRGLPLLTLIRGDYRYPSI